MRAKRLAVPVICLAWLCVNASQAGDQKELHALVDKAVKALGGAEKCAKLKTLTCKSKGSLFVPGAIPTTEEG